MKESKVKFNQHCDKCNEMKQILYRVGNWGIKTFECYECLTKDLSSISNIQDNNEIVYINSLIKNI